MSRKSRGCDYERKLVHLLQAQGFFSVRVAGSGCMRYPAPDILASNGKRLIAFEVKSSQSKCVYLQEKTVNGLLEFCDGFRAEPWLAVHLVGKGWFFKSARGLETRKIDEFNSDRQF